MGITIPVGTVGSTSTVAASGGGGGNWGDSLKLSQVLRLGNNYSGGTSDDNASFKINADARIQQYLVNGGDGAFGNSVNKIGYFNSTGGLGGVCPLAGVGSVAGAIAAYGCGGSAHNTTANRRAPGGGLVMIEWFGTAA
jgi:hypothetical protein